jgi:hypothetical protein
VFLGSTPIGAPFVGWLAESAGPRAGLVLGGVAAQAAAAGAAVAYARADVPLPHAREVHRRALAAGHGARRRLGRVATARARG